MATEAERTPDRGAGISSHRPPLDVPATARHCGISEKFLRRLIAERRIPFVKVAGTRIRFLPDDLDEWLAAQRVKAVR